MSRDDFFHVVLMFFCQSVIVTTAQYLMLLFLDETSECNLLAEVFSSFLQRREESLPSMNFLFVL